MLRNKPWDIVFLCGFCVYVWTRGVFASRARRNQWQKTLSFRGHRELLILLFIGVAALPLVYLATPWLGFADYIQPNWFPWVGTVLMVLALWLFWRSHVDLGLNWSMRLQIRTGHELVTSGVYARIRHPMYAAIWIFSLAQALLLPNWLAGGSALLCFAPLYFVRTPREERFMGDAFGVAYKAYQKHTGRLFPKF